MIAPRTIRLVRVPTLDAFQRAIIAASGAGDIRLVRATAVLVPTRTAAGELQRTFEDEKLATPGAFVLPDLLTRAEWYGHLHAWLPGAARALTDHEREAMLLAGSHEAITHGAVPPFDLRPALVQEMLGLYDALHRHGRTLDAFGRLLLEELEPRASFDRGAERLQRQTDFLLAAFRSYQRRAASAGALDEHGLRDALLASHAPTRHRRIVVTVGDRVVDPGGLWAADFDLLTRLHGIELVDVIATEEQLSAGFHQRLQAWLPELEEIRVEPRPDRQGRVLLVPHTGEPLYFTSRDREEEVRDLASRVKRRRRTEPDRAARLDRTRVVFARPLPYLYLARAQFDAARVPYECLDALPLAAEPAAAAVDLVLDFVAASASRRATTALLRSAHFGLVEGARVPLDAVHALDVALAEMGYDGDPVRLSLLVRAWSADACASADPGPAASRRRGTPAAAAADVLVSALHPLFAVAPASAHLDTLHAFLAKYVALPGDADLLERHLRGRTAILATLRSLAEAHRRHADVQWDVHDLAAAVRRWLEGQTFAPRTGTGGVRLLDAAAARYGRCDDVHLVGLVEGEWPERERRNLFYAPALLQRLGWADDRNRSAAARGAFRDLLGLAARSTSVSTFLLDNDGLVEPSVLLDELARSGPPVHPSPLDATPVSSEEALLKRPVPPGVLEGAAARWLGLRLARSPGDLPRFHGSAAPVRRPVHSVGSLELYAGCPFRYFARHVLRLEEEIEDEDGLSPRERGTFIHEVLEAFYRRWDAEGLGSISPSSLEQARACFEEVLEPHLARLSPGDARLERARLLGSPVASGLADMVLRAEALHGTPVLGRLLEDRFEGVFVIEGSQEHRQVALRGTVDRIDLLADGSLRLIDYKSSLPARPLQLAVYAITAVQRLRGHRGRDWSLGEVAYVVFGGGRGVVPVGRRGEERARRLAEAQQRLIEAVDGIERGDFPPRPSPPALCTSCAWAGVCRKDYVAQDGPADAAPAV